MALTPSQLIEPAPGGLSLGLFPPSEEEADDGVSGRSKLEAFVTEWLSDAEQKSPDDERAQQHWVRYQAFELKAQKLTEGPMTAEAGEDRVQYLISQADRFASKAAAELAAFEKLTTTAVTAPRRRTTGVISAQPHWA